MAERITYAIGDVHGRADLLETLLEEIERDAAERGGEPAVKFLGDVVDRGPDSRGAMELVRQTLAKWPGSLLHLGNHDDWFLDAMHGTSAGDLSAWLSNGGTATVSSYGGGVVFRDALERIRRENPEHVRMLREAVMLSVDEGRPFVFVHAGIHPGFPIADQVAKDCLWIRDKFLNWRGALPGVVVHGHTPISERPVVTENRISLDTGAFDTGRLTAMVADYGNRRLDFLQTVPRFGVQRVRPELLDRGRGTVMDAIPDLLDTGTLEEVPRPLRP